jgi:hypothetical protein
MLLIEAGPMSRPSGSAFWYGYLKIGLIAQDVEAAPELAHIVGTSISHADT